MGPVDLRARISAELNAIDDSVRRAATARARYELEHDDIFLDSVALNMQAVYTGMERTLTYLHVGER